MGDSDDDFDSRRNREKFRRERDDFNGNRAGDWNDGRFRRQYSGVPPPNKRFHRDFSSQRDESNQTFNAPIKESIETTSQPTFLTFKNFLLEQDDNIDQEEAVKLYSIYKNNFQKTQLAEFFSAHKNDDWFKFKYHPDEYPKRIEEQKLIIEKRRNIFIELYNNGHLDNLCLDISNEKDLIKYLDTIVMKLEGVNENDIRMTSIFFRQLTMKTTKDELENLCKIYDGFRRICLTDPIPERKFLRRAWATFDFNVEIRNICYELSSIKLHDLDMGVIVNRELKTRLRTVDLFNHEYDLNMVIKITQQLDKQSKISSNLLLENLDKNTSLKNLDYLILYLRIVYSFDYYNGSEYLQEDSMPNRCGVLHVRSLTNTSNSIELIDARLKTFMDNHEIIDDHQAKQLGWKNEQDEIEQFIKDNCQEISKDKWSCPLSGKKFKGPEFVRKHILNKYQDKLDEIKKQVEYFNNYLYDPKRPQYSLNQSHPSGLPLPIPMGIRPTFVPNYFPNSYRHPRPQFMHHGGPRPSNNRPMRNYEDLDAPTEF